MDGDLRALERLAAGGDTGAEARLLRLRVRTQALPLERVELAAYLGHDPAVLALGSQRVDKPVCDWVLGLQRWGRPVVVRALVSTANLLSPELDGIQRRQLHAADAWCACPCSRHATKAYQAVRAKAGAEPSVAYYAANAAHVAGNMPGSAGTRSLRAVTRIALRCALHALDAERVRQGIREALAPWAVATSASAG